MTFVLLIAAMFAVGGDESLGTARELYASAAYEEALRVLDNLPPSRTAEEIRTTEQYRALCLLALGRTADAETAITAVITRDPTYRPTSDVSPRVRAAFTDVRRKTMPAIVQQWYTQAKAQFDRKEYAAAASLFNEALGLMADPDVQAAAAQPPLSDLRTLASGFRDLAESAIAPPPPLPSSPEPTSAPAASVPETRLPAPAVYTSANIDVVPPIVIRQVLPPFPGRTLMGKRGLIEVVIDENGDVDSAAIQQTVTPQYDKMALTAAKSWRYEPAKVNGAPVKYRKSIQITVTPNAPPRD
jgi:TonB family protein